tara:strand:+ start:283 stop:483 length:201 start_codon:yes stop_codon:yes gene_type:complete
MESPEIRNARFYQNDHRETRFLREGCDRSVAFLSNSQQIKHAKRVAFGAIVALHAQRHAVIAATVQ